MEGEYIYRNNTEMKGIKVHNQMLRSGYDERITAGSNKSAKLKLTQSKQLMLKKVAGAYRIRNTVGDFVIGTEIPAGKYQVSIEFDNNLKSEDYAFYISSYKQGMDRYEDETSNYRKYNTGLSSSKYGWDEDSYAILLGEDRILDISCEEISKKLGEFTIVFTPEI